MTKILIRDADAIIAISGELNLFESGTLMKGHLDRAQHPYRTTNHIIVVGSYVFKRHLSRSGFEAERIVYAHRKFWTFTIPELVGLHTSKEWGNWLILDRISGSSITKYAENGGNIAVVVKGLVSALSEFEKTASKVMDIRFEQKLWSDSFEPLQQIWRSFNRNDHLDTFCHLAELADSAVRAVPHVPCFDAYHDNMIIAESSNLASNPRIVFLDFDKANFLVPIGEQLSHIAAFPLTAPLIDYAIELYSTQHAASPGEVQRTVAISLFFRAMSGVRDSLKWQIVPERQSEPPAIAVRRLSILSQCLTIARESLDSLGVALPISSKQLEKVDSLLSWLKETQLDTRTAS
jgi:hypothetical protein